MNKKFKLFYSALFFGVCSAPLIAFPFVKGNKELEKTKLTGMPSYVSSGKLNTNFSDQFEKWMNDNLPFRADLLNSSNYIKSKILTSPTSNVITGKDDWIFYETSAQDYMNTNPMTEKEISSIITTLSLIQENIESKGGKFLFAPVPNKSSIYGEYMPACYKKASTNNLTRLYEKLENSSVDYVNLKDVLLAKKDAGIYHKRDSHWNYLGALYGYNAIMDAMGKEHKTYSGASYTISKSWRGDLDKLLYPTNGFMDYQYEFDIVHDKFKFTYPAGITDTDEQLKIFMSDKEENDIKIKTKNKKCSDKSELYMVRDSFTRALLPFMIDNYYVATFERTNRPELKNLKSGTDMIYEIGERKLRTIIETAPFMEAPEREVTYTETKSSDKNVIYASKEGYGYRIYGTVDEEFMSEDSRIYVRFEGDKGTFTYEAFPIYETKLLENEDTKSKVGFSLILGTNTLEAGNYSISLISNETSSGNIINITY